MKYLQVCVEEGGAEFQYFDDMERCIEYGSMLRFYGAEFVKTARKWDTSSVVGDCFEYGNGLVIKVNGLPR